jgi:acyl-CoA thioester hydrolase
MPRIKIDIPEKFDFSTTIPVRITDINYGGHLGNDALLSIVHEARLQFLKSYGYSELDIEGRSIIMSDAAIVYKAEVFYGETLRIDIAVTDMQQTSCDIIYHISRGAGEEEVARVKTGIVFFDYNTRRPVQVPDGFRTRFQT